jgi:hypothetical protein
MTITAKFILNFTPAKAEAIIKAGTKLDRRYSAVAGDNYSAKAIALEAKCRANDEKWQAIADLITEDHSQYDAICFTGFLDS